MGAPDGAVRELDIGGRRYKSQDGMYELPPEHAAALRRAGGFAPSLGSPARGGYACSCGFRPVVRRCSRCGEEVPRAEENTRLDL
jgi:hypothetical protein